MNSMTGHALNPEIKVLTKTEYKTIRETAPSGNGMLEVPKYPEVDSVTESPTEENQDPDEDSDSFTTQMEKFERSVASEAPVEASPSPAEEGPVEVLEGEEPTEVIDGN